MASLTATAEAARVDANRLRCEAESLRLAVRSNLARYKVPREIVFIDEMPRNPAGKVVKRNLPDPDEAQKKS